MRRFRQIPPLLFPLLLAAAAFSQNDPVRIRSYGLEDGLSHRNVYKVQQDSNGFLWAATENGLNRFDGHSFLHRENAQENVQLPTGTINDMHLADGDDIWLATGIYILRLNPDKNLCDTVFPLLKQPFNKEVRHGQLLTDMNGALWSTRYFPADSSVYIHFMDEEGKWQEVARLPGHYENRPLARVGKHIFAGAYENEIWVFDEKGQQIKQFEFPAPNGDPSYSRIIALQVTADGTVWALLDHGQVYFLRPATTTFIRHPISDYSLEHIHSSAFLVNSRGDIWLSGIVSPKAHNDASPCSSIQPGATLLHYENAANTLQDYSYYLKQALTHTEPPRQMFEDRTGKIWISSFFGLINLWENNLFNRYMSDGNDCCRNGVCSMRGMAEDENGNIYFSYYNSIHVLNPRSGSLTPLFSPDVKEIASPFGLCYAKQALWTGNGMRIDLQNFEVDTLFDFPANLEAVVITDRNGFLWFGAGNKLLRVDPANFKQPESIEDMTWLLANDSIGQISYLHQGRSDSIVWVATADKGFFKINTRKSTVRHYHKKQFPQLPHDRILAMQENGGRLWLATANGLACLHLANDSMRVYTTKDGLPNNFINGLLLEGDTAIWASTDNGLCRLEIASGNCTSYYQSNGLPNNEFNRISFLRARDGRMYFGGLNGVCAFYPGARYGEKDQSAAGKLLLTEFAKYDGTVDTHFNFGLNTASPIELTYRDEMFTFWYSLSDFGDPKQHRYSYKLEGWDADWSEPSPINFARYFNIPAGHYKFRVRASIGGGNWVENELSMPVVIRQAFYKTRLFQMLALGFLTVLIYAIMRYRLYLHKKHEKELELQVQERTKELETEKQKSEELLLNILPAETADELKRYGAAKARRFENVTVMFTDFKGFTHIASGMEPEVLVAEIDYCFRAFDEIIEMYGLEKIKTIGDAYLCAGGISQSGEAEAAVRVVQAAFEIQSFLNAIALEKEEKGQPHFEARIGIHSGPVVAGIVGIKKFAYDIWGDTVNIAQRMQANGEVGMVNISKCTYELVKDHFQCTYRGMISAKNKGDIEMYFVSCGND